MNIDFKKELEIAFEAPEPKRMKEFLKEHYKELKISNFKFVISQIPYIRKRVWLISFVIILCTLIVSVSTEKELLWLFSSVMPFVALTGFSEYMKSIECNMTELEQSSRFSIKMLFIARLIIISTVNVLLLLFLLTNRAIFTAENLDKVFIAMLLPYLTVNIICLHLVRHLKEEIFNIVSFSVAVGVASVPIIKETMDISLFSISKNMMLAIVLFLFVYNFYKQIKLTGEMEELLWN